MSFVISHCKNEQSTNNKTLEENISKVEDVKDHPLKKTNWKKQTLQKKKISKNICINILRDTREYIAFMEQ